MKGIAIKSGIWAVWLLSVGWIGVFAQESQDLDVQALVQRVDRLYRSNSSYAEMEMTISTPHWERTLKMEAWTEGMDKTFIVILEPKKDHGIATLRQHQEMWNFFPKINKVVKVPPSMMMGSWMGSDFTNDDLVKESTLLDDYDARLAAEQDAGSDTIVLELIPHQQTATVWGKIELTIRRSDHMPLRQAYYDEDGTLMRVMTFSDIREMGGRRIPTVMEMVPLNKEDHKTVIRYLDADFDRDFGDDIFTLRNLQKKR